MNWEVRGEVGRGVERRGRSGKRRCRGRIGMQWDAGEDRRRCGKCRGGGGGGGEAGVVGREVRRNDEDKEEEQWEEEG